MKKKFSTKWKASSQPRKQRKFVAKAPLHIKRKMLSVNLSKDLRKKYGRRNIAIKKEDEVKIMRGKFKKKKGKVIEVKTKLGKIYVEGIQAKKIDGSKVNVPIKASNLQIIELNTNDKKRKLNMKKETTEQKKEKTKSKNSEDKNKERKE